MSKTLKKILIALCAACILIGVILIAWPEASRLAVCYIIGSLLALYGVVRICAYFLRKAVLPLSDFGVSLGIVYLIAGLVLLFKAPAVAAVFTVFAGVAIIIDSILRVQISFDFLRIGAPGWPALMISALLMLALGIVMLFDPFKGANAATVWMGISLLVDGVINLATIIFASHLGKKLSSAAPGSGRGTLS